MQTFKINSPGVLEPIGEYSKENLLEYIKSEKKDFITIGFPLDEFKNGYYCAGTLYLCMN